MLVLGIRHRLDTPTTNQSVTVLVREEGAGGRFSELTMKHLSRGERRLAERPQMSEAVGL